MIFLQGWAANPFTRSALRILFHALIRLLFLKDEKKYKKKLD